MNKKIAGTLQMMAAMLISGTIGWFVVYSGQPVIQLLFWRCVFGAATLLVVCAFTGSLRGRLTLGQVGWAAIGGVAIVLNWLLIFASFSRASISVAIAVYNTQPFMLIGLGALFFAERITAAKLGWLGIAFAGVLLIVEARPSAAAYAGPDSAYIAGVLMALGAAFFYAIAAIVTKKLGDTPPHLIALIHVCVGILMIAPFADLTNLPSGYRVWGDFLVMGAVYTGLVFALLYGAIQKLPTHSVGVLSFLYPIVAMVVDFVAFDHRLKPLQLVGSAAILVAAAGMTLGWSLQRAKAFPQA
ncbi:DMT family transporter [Variovorax soli]|uniref:Drug/metabolite transporter (DMT)-like permease n=1 Tax=Variovorax soli TaxID=376815 RepID=A0ABU1NJ19_9BURK|nr:DMT family transporter [Variovorax soli]MDR6538454.1 drug/metabolite transporter (DMT)-like permease [Variovorax soli]